ncbi:MAG: hypothetical protein EG822_00650 [Deltaproteobacteria bacterium]|nr:hypothetical protein [Deltaproteobacteria bacterium]TLN04564.1 MAG: hypothetical protein FDZ73_03405 [bacterium]
MIAIISAALLLLLISPDHAFAWGAGFHLQIGSTVLNNLQALKPALATLLSEYPLDYLYGCVAADITIGKKFTSYLQHCHRWPVGLKVLHSARSRKQEACAYGYLTHLAADTVAHNYFVPYKIMRSFPSIAMKHAYWEIRFENFIDKEIWEIGRKVCLEHYRANDELLRSVLSNTIFSFGTNKRIFNSILLLSRLEKWQAMLKTVSDSSSYALEDSDRQEYTALSEEAAFDYLNQREKSRYFLADPTGERALATAEIIRKNLRILYKSGKITKLQAFAQLEDLKPKLRQSICAPALLQQLHPTDHERKTYLVPRPRF